MEGGDVALHILHTSLELCCPLWELLTCVANGYHMGKPGYRTLSSLQKIPVDRAGLL